MIMASVMKGLILKKKFGEDALNLPSGKDKTKSIK